MAHENKKTKYWIIGGAAVIIILIWLWRRKFLALGNQAPPVFNNGGYTGPSFNYDPQLITYAQDPGKFGPLTVDGLVNISVSGYNGLNQNYMPLFGFVGMAQGVLWGNGYGGGYTSKSV